MKPERRYVFDNLMLCMSGDEAGNVFKMGQILGGVIRICNERGITPVFFTISSGGGRTSLHLASYFT